MDKDHARRFVDWDFVEVVKCSLCRWFYGYDKYPRCAAFPSGIPREIWDGRLSHDTPYPGDQGYRFEPRE
ncbi:MAG: hypothetical protein QW512_02715 [Thermofilaceae archaeon]